MAINPLFSFQKVKREQCKASIMIQGLTGSGKSGLALELGYFLAGEQWDPVFPIDTENKSLNLFEGIPMSSGGIFKDFSLGQLQSDVGFKPSNYLAFREAAKQAGAKVVIEDSITHAWMYKGGLLDLVNQAAERSKNKNDKYAAWKDPEVMKEKQELLELLRDPEVHVITTVRVKEKYEYNEGDAGKKVLTSLGEQQIMQDDIKYEPDLVLSMVEPGSKTKPPKALVIKSRYVILEKDTIYEFTPALMRQLREYLEEGTAPEVLLEQQRQDYITAVTEYLDKHKDLVPIWSVIKKDAGLDDVKLSDMPLQPLKTLFIKLTT